MGIMKHRKAMSGPGIVALVSACIVLLFVSCDAESIMNTGSTLGILSSAGLGNAGDKVVNSAADTTASFVEQYEQ
jgi:lipoprotein signal peptidase